MYIYIYTHTHTYTQVENNLGGVPPIACSLSPSEQEAAKHLSPGFLKAVQLKYSTHNNNNNNNNNDNNNNNNNNANVHDPSLSLSPTQQKNAQQHNDNDAVLSLSSANQDLGACADGESNSGDIDLRPGKKHRGRRIPCPHDPRHCVYEGDLK